MPDDDLQAWIAIECPAEDEAQDVQGGVDVPAKAAAGEEGGDLRRKAGVDRLDDRGGWRRRVELERNLECLGTLEDRPEDVVVEVTAPNVAADLPALEPVVADGALQFVCGGFRRRRGERRESGEARRMPLHGGPELIVRVAGDGDSVVGVELFHSRGHQ